MQTRLVKIGNSRGIRLPHAVIEEAGLVDTVELSVRRGVVTLRASTTPRAGWAEAAKACHAAGDDAPLLGDFGNEFDAVW